jgi:hypothetical protein
MIALLIFILFSFTNYNNCIQGEIILESKETTESQSSEFLYDPNLPAEIKVALLHNTFEKQRIEREEQLEKQRIEREERRLQLEEQREKQRIAREEQREKQRIAREDKRLQLEDKRLQLEDKRLQLDKLVNYAFVVGLIGSIAFLGKCLREGLLGSPSQTLAKSSVEIARNIMYLAVAMVTSGATTTIKRILQLYGKKF